jgi:hypothetical protein
MFFENILYSLIVVLITSICGFSFIGGTNRIKTRNFATKLSLSFLLGFVILSLAGLLANFFEKNIFMVQVLTLLFFATLGVVIIFLRGKKNFKSTFEKDKDDIPAIAFILIYILVSLYFFNSVIHWMAGDVTGHSSIIRMLLDGKDVPISIYPFGSYWEYYPKGFHYYAYFFLNLLPQVSLIELLKIIPVIITAFVSLTIYSIARELSNSKVSLYILIIATFCFVPHYAYLIWGGFPAATGEMLMLGFILVITLNILNKNKLLSFLPPPILLFLGIIFTHTRFLVYLLAILFLWFLWLSLENFWRNKRKKILYLVVLFFAIIVGLFALFQFDILTLDLGKSKFLVPLLTNQELAQKYFSMLFLFPLSILGFIIAIFRRDKLDKLAISLFFALLLLAIFVDFGIIVKLPISTDRVLNKLYIPLSIFAGYSLFSIEFYLRRWWRFKKIKKRDWILKGVIIGFFFLLGIMIMAAIFQSYSKSWGLPNGDYKAMIWLKNNKFENSIVINLDATGRWIYPLTGIQITNPKNREFRLSSLYGITGKLINDPTNQRVINELNLASQNYKHIFIYISNVTITKPKYKPPFLRFSGEYPEINTKKFSSEYYDLIYTKGGVYIYEYNTSTYLTSLPK